MRHYTGSCADVAFFRHGCRRQYPYFAADFVATVAPREKMLFQAQLPPFVLLHLGLFQLVPMLWTPTGLPLEWDGLRQPCRHDVILLRVLRGTFGRYRDDPSLAPDSVGWMRAHTLSASRCDILGEYLIGGMPIPCAEHGVVLELKPQAISSLR